MSGKQISFKAFVEVEQAVSYLEDLARSLRDGTVYVRQGAQFVELAPDGGMEIEVEAAEKKGKQKLSFELSWRRKVEPEPGGGSGLSISSEKPDIPEPEPEPGEADDEADAGDDAEF